MNEIELVQSLINATDTLPARDEELDALLKRADMIISNVFGESSKYRRVLHGISFYRTVSNGSPRYKRFDMDIWSSGKNEMLNLFKTMLEELQLFGRSSQKEGINRHFTNRIFVVHGHDEGMEQAVARTLEKLGLEPVVLHELPDQGRTIIEKFTDYSDVNFAVVLLSPDDEGYPKSRPEEAKPRARQNVIFELGFFVGKLGRNHVVTLCREEKGFEMPSDHAGVLYTTYDEPGHWQMDLVKELKACGYNVDADKLI